MVNFNALNLPINIKVAFDKGRLDVVFREMCKTADEYASSEAAQFQSVEHMKYVAQVEDAQPSSEIPPMSDMFDKIRAYKIERMDYYMKFIVHLLEIYAQTTNKG